MEPDFIIFGSPKIEQDEIDEVVECLRSGWLSTGPRVKRFERLFADYSGSAHAVAVNSCTAGLHLALIAAGVGPGDEVITTPFTFAATANVIVHAGAKPVFVDIDAESMNIDHSQVEAAVTNRTVAIIPVHFAGRPCNMTALQSIADKHNLVVINDAAHATETHYQGRHISRFGHITAFSFYATKNLVTGEGGMVLTDNDLWREKIKTYALHGLSHDAWNRYSSSPDRQRYRVLYPGFKYNMMDLQAALGIHQLKRLETCLALRRLVWDRYDEAFALMPVVRPAPPAADCRHARHLYTLLIDKEAAGQSRDDFRRLLYENGIGTGVHFHPLHLEPYYAKTFGYRPGQFPRAESLGRQIVSLPLSAKLSNPDVERIISCCQKILKSPDAYDQNIFAVGA